MSQQENKKGHNNQTAATIRRLMKYLKKYWFFLLASILMAAISVVLTLYLPILTGNAVDMIVEPGKVDFAGLGRIITTMAVCIGITAIAQWIMNVCNNRMTYGIVRDVRKDAFEKLQKLPFQYLDTHSSGEIVSRMIADVDQFADGLLMGFTQLFTR